MAARARRRAEKAGSAEDHYQRCLSNGCSPRLAEMLASRKAPASRTDNDWFRGKGKLLDQFGGNAEVTAGVVSAARHHGYNANENDVYVPQIAEFIGDPKAFVPACGGLGHIKKVCETRDIDCEGAVTHRRVRDPKPPQKVKLAKDLVDRGVGQLLKEDPGLAVRPIQELRERVIEERSVKITELD